jgi:Fuc2NAc and GlcNAc transferase
MNWIILSIFILSIISTYLLTRIVKHYALIHNITDIPNKRSSHSIPTPRGGGLAIVISFLMGIILYSAVFEISFNWLMLLVGGGWAIAWIGWVDDKKALKPWPRMLVHFFLAGCIIFIVGPEFSLSFIPTFHLSNYLSLTLIIFYIVWMINLYNFMDGIDGLASSQCLSVSTAACIFAYLNNHVELTFCYGLLSAISIGFLFFNWHPAKIFLGDVGSGFLGFMFALLAVWGEYSDSVLWITVTILMGVFIVDATFTLLKRLVNKQVITQPHRDHTYQKLVLLGWSHSKVSFACLGLNIFWLTPCAALTFYFPEWSILIAMGAFLPLLIIAIYIQAGTRHG